MNKKYIYLILLIIMGVVAHFMSYHIDYPEIGYHSWKNVNYETCARNFAEDGFFSSGFFIPRWNYPALHDDPSGVHSDTFPTTSIITALAFMIFGYELWIARAISIFFALGSIIFFYLIIKKLFKREDLALTSAGVMAINPLLIFFGRQVQLINVALFLCLIGTYYFIKWKDTFKLKHFSLFVLPMMLGVLTKYSFALFMLPILCTFPYKRFLDEDKYSEAVIGFLSCVAAVSWFFYSKSFSANIGSQVSTISLGMIFSGKFWTIMQSYARDNYTMLGLSFAIFGLSIFLLLLNKNIQHKGFRFMSFYLIGSIIWFVVMAEKLSGHSYHQYPILPLVIFFIAYAFIIISTNLSKIIKLDIKWIIIIILLGVLLIPCLEAKNRMFDTQFYGSDVAGEYIKANKQPGERVMFTSTGQTYGILWHGDIFGIKGIKSTAEDVMYAEENLNCTWIYMYNLDFHLTQTPGIWDYIKENYELKQMGFMNTKQGFQPLYFLLKRGGSFDVNNLSEMVKNQKVRIKEYELTSGKINMNFINFQ